MLKNYLKISIRNLANHKLYTAVNVLGLALGLTAFLLIYQYIKFERSYDGFLPGSGQIYRLTTDQIVNDVIVTRDAMSWNPAGKELVDEIPEITNQTTTQKPGSLTFRKGETLIRENNVLWVDEHFLEVFPYPILSGVQGEMLKEPHSVILTRDKAELYFGKGDPIGQTIHLYSGYDADFKVVGVIENVPANTHYGFDMLLSIITKKKNLEDDGWNGYNYYVYLTIDEGTDMAELEERMIPIKDRHIGEENNLFFNLQPVEDIHLYSDFTFEPEAHGSAKSVKFLQIISVFILVIAWINYVNLSTAKAVDRSKEVGLRKTVGASKGQIRAQFMFESFIVNFLGGIIAFFLAVVLVPYFNQLVGKPVIGSIWLDFDFLMFLGVFVLIGTILSGFYPALFLSNFKVVSVLKGKFRNSSTGIMLRKGLVILQFSTSLILIIGTFVVIQQVNYMRAKDVGMSLDQVVGFFNPGTSGDWDAYISRVESFQQDLKKSGTVLSTATMSNLPGGGSSDINSSSGGVRIVGLTELLERTTYSQGIDHNTLDVLGVEILYGRSFKKNFEPDSASVVVNESFIERFGLPVSESLINEKIQMGRNPENRKFNIVGIVKDVNRTSLKKEVEPTIFFSWNYPRTTVVKLASGQISEGLEHLESTWQSFFPNESLDYQFLDERFARLYEEDERFGKVFGAFSTFALIVAILGLFGLSAFMAAQRTKEVGVRKVLGASILQIFKLFYKEFLVLIFISAVIGLPIVFWFMSQWLQGYAYHISFPWIYVVVAIVILIASALGTVGYQVWRVAVLNPAKTLKYE